MKKQMYNVGDRVLVAAELFASDFEGCAFEIVLEEKFVSEGREEELIYGFVPWRPERGKLANTEGGTVKVLYIHGNEAYCEYTDASRVNAGMTTLIYLEDLHAPA
jgi:hypothetical protein